VTHILPVVINVMVEAEREEVSRFVHNTMQRTYGCDAHALPSFVLVARQSGALVGSVALAFDAAGTFPLEVVYALDENDFPIGCNRADVVQFGRWAASKKGISEVLLYCAIAHALARGFLWGMSEVKPAVARRFAQLGLRLHVLPARANLGCVPAAVLPYYLSPPPPVPCLLFLPHAYQVLRGRIGTILCRGVA